MSGYKTATQSKRIKPTARTLGPKTPTTKAPGPATKGVGDVQAGPIRGDEDKEESWLEGLWGGAKDVANDFLGNDARTGLEDFDFDQLKNLDPGTILRFAFSPDDKADLNLEGEEAALKEVASVLSIDNPTPELMKMLADSGKFQDLIWSGHGTENGLLATGADGDSVELGKDELKAIFEDSSIEEAMLAACDSGDAANDAFYDVGIESYAYDDEVSDARAIEELADFAEGGDLEDLQGDAEHEGRRRDGNNVEAANRRRRQQAKNMDEGEGGGGGNNGVISRARAIANFVSTSFGAEGR